MQTKRAGVPAMDLEGRSTMVPIDQVSSGVNRKRSTSWDDALVAYIDILGFGAKRDPEEIERTLIDFAGPLTLVATKFPSLRVNVFSDCAFVATSRDTADDLLAGLRFAFKNWAADGILVRGGLSYGQYNETKTFVIDESPANFSGNIFAGTGVVNAVRQESTEGGAALLYVTEDCAQSLADRFGEQIFNVNERRVVGWAADDSDLVWYAGISLIRALRHIEQGFSPDETIVAKLLTNVRYALTAGRDSITEAVCMAILGSDVAGREAQRAALEGFGWRQLEADGMLKELAAAWNQNPGKRLMVALAMADSSLPPHQHANLDRVEEE